jgi:uncharacterized membrane protein YkvA (DUF1232 family)
MDTTAWIVVLLVAVLLAVALAVAVTLLVRLVRTRRALRRAGLPTGSPWVFWGAVAYVVLPADLLPDPAYLDDIGVLLLALRSMRAAADRGTAPRPRTAEPQRARGTETHPRR